MRIRRALMGLVMTGALLTATIHPVVANQAPLGLYLNGRELYMPTPLVIQEGRVLVPMRAYVESLGAEISWHPPDRVTASLGGRTVDLRIGSTVAQVDGNPVPLDVPAQLINDRTYLPLRFLSEGLGAQVDYDGTKVTVQTKSLAQIQVIDGPLNVRKDPTTASAILTTVPNGTVLNVVREPAPYAWTEVRLSKGTTGWVANQYTRKVAPQPLIEPFRPILSGQNGFLQIGGECLGIAPMIDERVYVPLRESVLKLGGSISLTEGGATVRIGNHQATVTPGETMALLDGQETSLLSAPVAIGGQVLIAARSLADLFNVPLSWSDTQRTATLNGSGGVNSCNPTASANAYLLMDAATGVVLSEYNSRTAFPIASTTKIMTALLAVEQGDPHSQVTVSWNAANQPGTSVYLRTGEQRTLQELLYGLMLVSGNDAATAIAEHLSGSEAAFAQAMNQRATQLGATKTHFDNASGLDDWVNPYSTARDLATITRHAMQNTEFRVYMSQSQVRIPGPSGTRLLTNSNDFVRQYAGATGVKNGWTEKANHTLVVSAFRNNRELILVLLGAPSRTSLYQQATTLMDHGFRLADKSWLLHAVN